MQADALIGTHTHLQGGWCVSFLVKRSCSSIRLCDEASLMWSQSEAANPLTASMATVHFPPLFSNYRLGEAPPPPTLLRQGRLLLTQMNSSSGLKWNWDSAGRRSRLAVKKRATPQEDEEGNCLQGLLLSASLGSLACLARRTGTLPAFAVI